MNVVSSNKFSKSWLKYIDYAIDNYGDAIATKKKDKLKVIIKRLQSFPESGHTDPFLQNKIYRVVKFEKTTTLSTLCKTTQ